MPCNALDGFRIARSDLGKDRLHDELRRHQKGRLSAQALLDGSKHLAGLVELLRDPGVAFGNLLGNVGVVGYFFALATISSRRARKRA